jgi:chromosome segregation ATPase
MTLRVPDRLAKSSSSAIVLVECSVKLSPTLARLIRKSAEKEAGGVSATDALLAAAGIQAHELATLRQEVAQVSGEARRMREQAAHEHGQFDQAKTAIAQRDKEITVLRGDLRKTTEAAKGAQQQMLDLRARIAELAISLESRDAQLAHSLPLSGLDDGAIAAVKALRDRLAQGEIQYPGNTAADVKAMIENLSRPEMRALSKMLSGRAWRIRLVRWLLRVRTES